MQSESCIIWLIAPSLRGAAVHDSHPPGSGSAGNAAWLVALVAPGAATAADSNLVVAGAWIRQPPPGSDVAAVYLSLEKSERGPSS